MENRKKALNNAKLFIALSEDFALNVKRLNITDCIKNGADVNVRFADDGNNTPLHVAVLQHDKEAVYILLKHGAKPTITNDAGKTALDIAKELPDRAIAEILGASELAKNATIEETPTTVCTYKKRPGTANIRGQLYETKLLTTIYLRALTCSQITQFHLGTNVDGIGDMDDVCMRLKTINADCVIFLQAKHKQDIVKGKLGLQDLWRTSGDYSLLKYFSGYRKLREKFNHYSDVLCHGNYEEVKPYYVLYTTLKDDVECSRKVIVADDVVTNLLRIGENSYIFQLAQEKHDVDRLTRELMVGNIKNMGKNLFKLIQRDKCDDMLIDEHIRSYHVVLARKVINVTEVNKAGSRVGTFREEFFSSTEELLIVLRKTLYTEAIKSNILSTKQIGDSLGRIIANPSAETISELIGNVLEYDKNTNTLKLTREVINSEVNFQNVHELSVVKIPQTVVSEAYEIAGRKKLQSLIFNLPAAFGNVDMTINKKKLEKRLQYLADKLCNVIEETADTEGNVVIREGMYNEDKCLDKGVLAINGGLAGAVGNFFVSDDNNKLKFNLDDEALGENAKQLSVKLKDRLGDLQNYRFIIEIDNFPRLSLQATEREKRLVRDFLDNLYFFTCQAKEEELEKIVTKELQARECSGLRHSENIIKSNALFLKIHNEIQSWWMREPTAYYLTRNMPTFDKIFSEVRNNGLLAFLNFIYLNKIHNIGLEFTSEAIDFLCRIDASDAKMIVVYTDVHVLTGHKLVQHYRGSDNIIFLDIDYVWKESSNLETRITAELSGTDIKVVVIICEDASKYNMKEILRDCKVKKILVTRRYEPLGECLCLRDENINLSSLTKAAQSKVLGNYFVYQGIKVTFEAVFHDAAKHLIDSKILHKIINNETITLGQSLETSTYHEIKHYYVPRTLRLNIRHLNTDDTSGREFVFLSSSSDEELSLQSPQNFSPTTLIDQHRTFKRKENRDVILILDAPGMGKSTLLTHLSLETKKRYPDIWIQRINLIDYTRKFHHWHENKTQVDSIEAFKFLCNVILNEEASRRNVGFTERHIDLEIVNDEVKFAIIQEEDALVTFELITFLHCFYNRRIVFLFDGFDEICPHYKLEVTQLLKILTRQCSVHASTVKCGQKRHVQRFWITSRPYNELRETLENEFGEAYTLQPFDYTYICVFVYKYMRRNLNLNELTTQQLKNIKGFFKYMKLLHYVDNAPSKELRLVNIPLHRIYVAVVEYFKSEVKRSCVPDDILEYVKHWVAAPINGFAWRRYFNFTRGAIETITLSGVPLHIYIIISYFQSQIKHNTESCTEDLIRQWDLDINTFGFYERFTQMKLKVRFEEKSQMDLYKPDVKMTYEKEIKEFMDKHKKLAFYAVCSKTSLTDVELDEVKVIIKEMETAKDKTGLVDRIVDGEPKFVQYTFAEYFAVEYIVDVLKSGDPEQQKRMMKYVLWEMVPLGSEGISSIFDLRLKFDPKFAAALRTPFIKCFVLEELIAQSKGCVYYVSRRIFPEYEKVKEFTQTALDKVVLYGLVQFAEFLIDAITTTVDISCFNDFMTFVKKGRFLYQLMIMKCDDLAAKVLDCIRQFNPIQIDDIFPPSWLESRKYANRSNDEFIGDCRKCEKLRKYYSSRYIERHIGKVNISCYVPVNLYVSEP